jgi:pantoate--beta-alanine ligase
MMAINVYNNPADVRAAMKAVQASDKTVGFVPTMGALHEGHIELGKAAAKACGHVIYSIFVNPLQFAPHEDFDRYPRMVDKDIARLEAAGIHSVYLPAVKDMYPDDFVTRIHIEQVTQPLEGEFRPHFFDGVATVVTKLLMQVLPDKAFFGEKDYQQLQVIKRLVQDLNMPIAIEGVATVRDEQGLALSSRNAYLTPEQLTAARQINVILRKLGNDVRDGKEIATAEAEAVSALLGLGFNKVDYCTVRDAKTLQKPDAGAQELRALVAAWIGQTRLIDNLPA